MTTTADQSRTNSPDALSPGNMGAELDVPGLMATRVGDLYAEEERLRRVQRTERMILKAQSSK